MKSRITLWGAFVLVLSLLVCSRCSAEMLFYHSFDDGFTADYARGNQQPIHHDRLELSSPGRTGQALWVKPKQYIRFETEQNLETAAGTVILWVKTNYTPPQFREEFGAENQSIFNARIRTDHFIGLVLNNRVPSPRLWLMVGNGKGKRTDLFLDIDDWAQDRWHKVVISWEAPGKLMLALDDKESKTLDNAHVPIIPATMLYDFYLGTNSKQSAHAFMGHFDGLIDDVAIFDEYNVTSMPVAIPQKTQPACPDDFDKDPRWIGANTKRVNLYVKCVSDRWRQVPAKVDIELDESWNQLSPQQKRAAINSFRLTRYDARTGAPIVADGTLKGSQKYFLPFQLTSEIYYTNAATLRFLHAGTDDAGYSFYYDLQPQYEQPFPLEIPMVGNGDRLRLGLKNTVGKFSPAIAAVFDVYDLDRDGDLDFWMNSGTLLTNHCNNLMVGHYYFENVSDEIGAVNTFAPGKLIIRDNTPTGYISGVVIPNICDINSDGTDDMLMLGRSCREWWEWRYEHDKPVVTKIHELKFDGDPIKTEVKVVWYDWDSDGLGDIFAAELPNIGKDEVQSVVKVYRNVGTAAEPVIDTRNPITVKLNSPDLQWHYIPVDWDYDGDVDLVSSGFIHELYFFENTAGSGREPVFADPVRLTAMDRREIDIPHSLIVIKVIDWDADGDHDLLWSAEGAIGYVENIAGPGKLPQLRQTVYLNQLRPLMDAGAISIPAITDWDDDGDKDMILASSNAMKYYENVGSAEAAVWHWGRDMYAGDTRIHLPAGENGSVQGIEELGWQYNNAWVADWDHDGLKDLLISGIRGEHHFFRNIGRPGYPRLAQGQLIEVDWPGPRQHPEWQPFEPVGDELLTVWRTRPVAMDWNHDGLCDYITLDHKGEMALYLRKKDAQGRCILEPGRNIFEIRGPFSQAKVWNRPPNAQAGRSGRTVFSLVDWDKDGDRDLIMDNVNARYYKNITDDNRPVFVDQGDMVKEGITNHNDGPFVTDWDGDGWDDLLIGAESGRVFYFSRPYIEGDVPVVLTVNK